MNTCPPEVLLVGVDHRIQYTTAHCGPDWRERIKQFEDYLVELTVEHGASLIAEEFNEEALDRSIATDCTARDAAQRANRAHLFCEPPSVWRNGRSDALSADREMYWLECLKISNAKRIIFLCGNDHLVTFQRLLVEAGYVAIVESKNWGAGWQLVQ